jgi:hypothetical protein
MKLKHLFRKKAEFIVMPTIIAGISVLFFMLARFRMEKSSGLIVPLALVFAYWAAMKCQTKDDPMDASFKPTQARARFGMRMLSGFRWFCSKETREVLELVIADLKRDAKEMKRENRSEAFISLVLGWKSQQSILSVLWAAILAMIERILPIGRIIKAVKWW